MMRAFGKAGVTIPPPESTSTHWLFPGVAEESMPVLLLTTRRVVFLRRQDRASHRWSRSAARSQTRIGHRGVRPGVCVSCVAQRRGLERPTPTH